MHHSIEQAWFLTEIAYLMVKDKYRKAGEMLRSEDQTVKMQGSEARSEVAKEVNRIIFGVNDEVESLFRDAIEKESDNPLNHAAYAYYLKPRRRWPTEDTPKYTEVEAFELMDQAIEMWPDEPSFYLLKIHIITAPHQVHDWFHSGAGEKLAIADQLPMIMDCFSLAEKHMPDNHYVNYYRAILLHKLNPYAVDASFENIREELLREIRAGNRKPYGFFSFPPPLHLFGYKAKRPTLRAEETKAVYVDHWANFGFYDSDAVSDMVKKLTADMTWPEDKDNIAEIMYFLYQLGLTQPYARSFFSWQLMVLDQFASKLEPGSDDALAFAEVSRFLNNQYHDVATRMFRMGSIKDSNKVNVDGLVEAEGRALRRTNLEVMLQGKQAAYLKKVEEVLGLSFPLPDDPAEWTGRRRRP